MNLPNREFGPFSRVNPPLTDPMVVGTAFGLEKGQRSGLLDTPEGMYVMESLERVPADSAKFVKELDEYRTKMIDMARQARVRGYLAALRQSAKIVDNRAQAPAATAGGRRDPAAAGHLTGATTVRAASARRRASSPGRGLPAGGAAAGETLPSP